MRARDDLPFAIHEYEQRLERARAEIDQAGLEVLLITVPANLHYLTGYDTQGLWYPNILVLPVVGEPFMVTRQAEDTVVQADTWVEVSRPFSDSDSPMVVLAEALSEFGLADRRLGVEDDSYYLRLGEFRELCRHLPKEPTSIRGLVERCRVIKSTAEIDTMRRSARATGAGVARAVEAITAGATENEIAAAAYAGMLTAGGHWGPMAPFVVSGPRAFVSHATWRDRRLLPGDAVFLEIGACVDRYQTASMRTACLGPASPKLLEAAALVDEATVAAMELIRPGARSGDIDRAARQIIARNSFGADQNTRVGYGMGIAFPPGWGEGHIIDIKEGDERILEAGMTFHLIPFLQIPGEAQVGTSETIVVTPNGCEALTASPRELFER